ncbi:MAG TPA: hypothetical protein VNL39_13690 [Xanthobacteraceae bacterium]|nr:hypothetical protein [Xanthobacteraceae bacterium]
MKQRLNIILLADDRHPALALREHINALVENSRHRVQVVNPIGNPFYPIKLLHLADVLAIHYSIYALYDWYLPARFRRAIGEFAGLKVQFIQDEYRLVYPLCEVIADMGVEVIFTLVRPDLVEQAYNHPRLKNVQKVSVLPGYVPDNLGSRPVPPIAQRQIDIGYRSRRVPYWLGTLGQDKIRIAEGVRRLAPKYRLRYDISIEETKRFYGEDWYKFVSSCKAVLGTEGGASIWDYDGSAQRAAEAYLDEHPEADFEEVWNAVLAPFEGNLMYNTMSPRIFEAAALRTPMIMFPGWYNGVVEPERHYIVLEKDFSNFADVAERLRDDAYLQALAERTHADLIASGKYSARTFAVTVDEVIEGAVRRRGTPLTVASDSDRRSTAAWHRLVSGIALSLAKRLRIVAALYRVVSGITLRLSISLRAVYLAISYLRRLVAAFFQRGKTAGDRFLEVSRLLGAAPHQINYLLGAPRALQILVAPLFYIPAYALLFFVWGVRLLRSLIHVALDGNRSGRARVSAIQRRLRRFRRYPRIYSRLLRIKRLRSPQAKQSEIQCLTTR